MKWTTFALILSLTFISAKSQSKVIIKLHFVDSLVSCKKDNFRIDYEILNKTKLKLHLPSELILLNDVAGDLEYRIEKYNDSAKKFITYRYLIDEMPYREITFKYLYPGKQLSNTNSLLCLFNDSGKYRMRLILHSSRFNKEISDYYSNWATFYVFETYKINDPLNN